MAEIDKLTLQITSNTKSAVKGLDSLIQTLERLDNATRGGLGLDSCANGIREVTNATRQSTSANNANAKSYTNMRSKINMAYTSIKMASKIIASCISKTNDYIETVNLFNVSMGKFAKEAGEYAETVSEVMGIDPSEWMRNQGMFMTLATGFGVVEDRAYTMSKNLTQLGYDISSFFNISYDDAMAKLQSGLAGELEPLRRIGYDLSQARLQQEAYILGIDKKVAKMTQAEKAELRYYAIMTQVTNAQGDMARTLSNPANQLRIFSANITQAARAIGSIFIPILNAVLPYLTAFARLIRDIASNIASFFGFEMPEVDYSGVSGLAGAGEDAANALGDATDKAKKLKKYAMGFDELNVIDPNEDDKDKGGDNGLGGSGFDFALPEYDFLSDALTKKIDALKTALGMTISDVFLEWGDNLNAENILEKIVTGLGLIAGTIIGFKLGGVKGAAIGALVGMSMALVINSLIFDHDGKVSGKELFELLRDVLIVGAGGAVGFAIGGLKGAAIGLSIGFSLAVLLEAVELKGSDKVAHGLENALMAAVPVGLGAGLGKQVANTFLIGFDDAFTSGAGVAKSLSAGLSSVSSSMSTLGKAVTGVVGGLASFMGVFTGVKNITYDVSTGSATLGSVFSGLIPILAGLTAGFVAFSIAFNSTGIGLIVTAIVAAGAALVGLIAGIEDASKAAYESTTDFAIMEGIISRSSTTIDNCNTALENMQSGIEKIDTVSDNFAMASTLVSEIMEINENANASAYELAEMQAKVDILNGLGIEGLSLSIDETTGRVIESRDAVEKLIASLEQEAKMEAMRDLLVQSYKDQFAAQRDLVQASNDYNVASEALQKTRDKLNNSEGLSFKQKRELRAAEEEQIKALNSSVEAMNTAKSTYDTLGETIEIYTGELTDMKLNEMGVGDELSSGVKDALASVEEVAGKMPESGKAVADGLKNGVIDNVKKEEYTSCWQKIGNWFKDLFGINSPSKVFTEYGGFLSKGLFGGVDKNIKQKDYTGVFNRLGSWFTNLLGISGKSSSVFNGFGSNIASGLFSGVDKNTKQKDYDSVYTRLGDWFTKLLGISNKSSSVFTDLGKFTANGLFGGVSDNTRQKDYDGVYDRLRSWFTNLFGISANSSTVFKDLGKFTANGLFGGVSENTKQSDYDGVFGRLKTWFTSKLGISGTKSSVFDTLGNYVAGGLFDGVSKNTKQTDYDGVYGRLKTWFNNLFGTSGGKSTVFDTFGSYLAGGLKSGVDGGVKRSDYDTIFGRVSDALSGIKGKIVDIVNSILGFIEKMANGVIGGINSMINKLNTFSVDTPDWVEEKFGIGKFGFNIKTLGTISVPRISLYADGGFPTTGQMFIAREAGAEMVGSIGRKTAVANNDQIVEGIAYGVSVANKESDALLREQNSLLREMVAQDRGVYLDGKEITKSVERHQYERGRVIVTGGAY